MVNNDFSIISSMVSLSTGFGFQGCNYNQSQSKNTTQDLGAKSVVTDIISIFNNILTNTKEVNENIILRITTLNIFLSYGVITQKTC
ncbi:MAG: hypothetical protein K2I71_02030 [Helicobacter sp.]|nr:hypothetical protein [Helicobacter sp.]